MTEDVIERVIWSPGGNWAQWELLQRPVFEVFFGGARGGGKTDGMLGEWITATPTSTASTPSA
jgi:hypothetical protein